MRTSGKFDLQPTLTGKRVVVRPIEPSDWAAMFAAASDPHVWEQHPEADRYTEAVFRNYFDGAIACGSGFAFIDRSSGEIIGSSRYNGHDGEKSEIEIGWTFLSRDYWGGSYNLEIKQLMLDHAFQFVDIVIFRVGENNTRSRRAMEKIGGVLRVADSPGKVCDDDTNVVYEIHKQDWEAANST